MISIVDDGFDHRIVIDKFLEKHTVRRTSLHTLVLKKGIDAGGFSVLLASPVLPILLVAPVVSSLRPE